MDGVTVSAIAADAAQPDNADAIAAASATTTNALGVDTVRVIAGRCNDARIVGGDSSTFAGAATITAIANKPAASAAVATKAADTV